MGLEASADPDLAPRPALGGRVTTPSGMVLDGPRKSKFRPFRTRLRSRRSKSGNEIDPALVDYLEFYLLNYFKPGHSTTN